MSGYRGEGKMTKKLTFEESMDKLEELIANLEAGDVELAESLEYFSQGVEIIKKCKNELAKAEESVKILIDEELKDFSELKGE